MGKGYRHSPEAKEKMRLSKQKLYSSGYVSPRMGKKNPFFTELNKSRTGLKLSEEHRKNIGKSSEGRAGWMKGLTKETDERINKISKSLTGRKLPAFTEQHKSKMASSKYGSNNPAKRDDVREKIRISKVGLVASDETKERMRSTKLKQWQNEEFKRKMLTKMKSSQAKPNNPEKILMKIIEDNNLPFNYVGDGKIWFKGENTMFNPDFLSKNPKHIIEVFGDYWHNLPKSKERDERRIETYQKYGYQTLIIWEKELKKSNNSDFLLTKINEFLGRR